MARLIVAETWSASTTNPFTLCLAQVEPRQIWFGRAYIAAFVVVIFYDELPWADLMLDWLR
jgi:hypothetical protein